MPCCSLRLTSLEHERLMASTMWLVLYSRNDLLSTTSFYVHQIYQTQHLTSSSQCHKQHCFIVLEQKQSLRVVKYQRRLVGWMQKNLLYLGVSLANDVSKLVHADHWPRGVSDNRLLVTGVHDCLPSPVSPTTWPSWPRLSSSVTTHLLSHNLHLLSTVVAQLSLTLTNSHNPPLATCPSNSNVTSTLINQPDVVLM